MKFSEDSANAQYRIQAYGDSWIQINDQRFHQPLIISAQTLLTDWQASSMQDLQPEQLEPLFVMQADVILLGTGQQQVLPGKAIQQALVNNGTGFEWMANAAACRTYNILLAEGRAVAMAIFP